MSGYARLRGAARFDPALAEHGEMGVSFAETKTADRGLSVDDENARVQNSSGVEHTHTLSPSAALKSSQLQHSEGHRDNCRAQQEQVDPENGRSNVCLPDPTTQPTVVAVRSHSSPSSGVSLQEQQHGGGGRLRWVGRGAEERSCKCRSGCEAYQRDTMINGSVDSDSVDSNVPSSRSACCQWTPSIERGTPYRERGHNPCQGVFSSRAGTEEAHHLPAHPLPPIKSSCTVHSACNADFRYCQRYSKPASPRDAYFSDSERKVPPLSDAAFGACFTQERNPTFQRSNSARSGVGAYQRHVPARDSSGQTHTEMTIENWRDHPASKSAHVSDRTRHRVSFSLTENHELETQKLREKWRDPLVHSKRVLQTKQPSNQPPVRYNCEQTDVVDREKENIGAGKGYTVYGMKEVKECSKGTSGRHHHHQLVKAFSVRENNTNYTKIPRAYSVNAGGRHAVPMECDTCGKGGIGVVFVGLPGNGTSCCKACGSSPGWGCSDGKPPRKKKSIMEYCRKLLRLPQKSK